MVIRNRFYNIRSQAISPALALYIFSSILNAISFCFTNDLIYLISKPIITCSLFIYYLEIKNINIYFDLTILCFFFQDLIVLFKLDLENYFLTILNSLIYIIIVYCTIKNMFEKPLAIRKVYFLVIVTFLNYLFLFFVLYSIESIDLTLNILFFIKILILSVLASLLLFNFLFINNQKNDYGIIMCCCFITSNTFFFLYKFYIKNELLYVLKMLVQFASYFFLLKYFTTINTVSTPRINTK
jgi:hypothetical protein